MTNSLEDLDQTIQYLHDQVRQMLDRDASELEIIGRMEALGYDPHYTRTLIANVLEEKDDQVSFRSHVLTGFGMIVGGVALNVLSYQIADRTDASFFYVFWGVIAWGCVLVIRAFVLFRK